MSFDFAQDNKRLIDFEQMNIDFEILLFEFVT